MTDPALVKLTNYRNRIEAEADAGLLNEAGIPYLIQSPDGGGVIPAPGGATILVRSEHLHDARLALEQYGPRLVD